MAKTRIGAEDVYREPQGGNSNNRCSHSTKDNQEVKVVAEDSEEVDEVHNATSVEHRAIIHSNAPC